MQNPIYFENSIPGADRVDLQQCVLYYQDTNNEKILPIIFYQLRSVIRIYLYNKTNYADKAELLATIEDKILDCLSTYKSDLNCKFKTYLCRCLDNAIINLVNEQRYKMSVNSLSLDFKYESSDDTDNTLYNFVEDSDNHYTNIDTNLFLESIKDKLDSNEYRVCRIIMKENHKLKFSEIARASGLTLSAISPIWKRLRKKFAKLDLYENFTKSI